MRLFFDFAAKDQSLRDYQGGDFRTHQSAIEYADAVAYHMKNSLLGDWIGWCIEVRNAEGIKLFSLPVELAGRFETAQLD